jgi:Tol biopolymer transport system component
VTVGAGDNVVPSWSADNKTIYFASNRAGDWQIYKVPSEGESAASPAVQLTKRGGFSAFESPDGKWIYYAKGREVAGLWKILISGGGEQLVTPDLQAGYWGYWAMGRSAVYFVSCDKLDHCAINTHSLTTNESAAVALLPKEPPFMDSALSISRDGRSFLVPQVDHAQSNIMLGEGFH